MTPVGAVRAHPFWEIGDRPYGITLGPHAFYWFRIVESAERLPGGVTKGDALSFIDAPADPTDVLTGAARGALEQVLPSFLARHPWFGWIPGSVLAARLLDVVAVGECGSGSMSCRFGLPSPIAIPRSTCWRSPSSPAGDAADLAPGAPIALVRTPAGDELCSSTPSRPA